MRLCYSCSKVSKKDGHLYAVSKLTKHDLEILRKKAPLPSSSNTHKKSSTQNIHFHLGKTYAGRKVFYYGANPKDCKGVNHNVAYKNLKNCGVTTINKEGKVTLKIKCPQSYFEKGKRFMKHIHLVISNKQRTDWLNKLVTIGVLCKVNRIPSCYHKLHLNKAVLRTLKNSTSAKIMKMLGITRKMKPERCSIALLGLNEDSRMKAYIILSKKGFTDIIQKSGMRGGGLFNTITSFFTGKKENNTKKNSNGNQSDGNSNTNSNGNQSNINSNTNNNNEGNIYHYMYNTNKGGINWMNIGANDPGPNNESARRYVNNQLRQPNRQITNQRPSNR